MSTHLNTHLSTRMDEVMVHVERPRSSLLGWIAVIGGVAVIAVLMIMSLGHEAAHHAPTEPPPYWGIGIMPFIGLLGCIAVLPLLPATHHWWESNLNRLGVSMGFAGLTVVYYVLARGVGSISGVLEHAILAEYIPFIVLLFSLYVISGGISLTGDLAAKPSTNTAFLAFGAAIASFIGTTGASMLLIRPLLQTNHERKHVVHTVVFFIFLVSNVGGTLLPIGDPPLFLGFLKGVPFFWTLNLWAPWLVCCLILLVVYYIWDSIAWRRETDTSHLWDEAAVRPLRLQGWINVALLVGVVACVAFVDPTRPLPFTGGEATDAAHAGHGEHPPGIYPFPFMREMLMLLLVLVSLWRTPKSIREYNHFNYMAILEVAALFIGIFIAMQVPIEYLNARGAELGVNTPTKFFWATGGLSSFLDNAPTYVVFFETAKVLPDDGAAMLALGGGGQINVSFLVAISLGAVFMGAMTYIGNGPNFMVKSIAEQTGIRMPSFFGYLVKYSLPILIPVFIVITLLFLLPGSPLA